MSLPSIPGQWPSRGGSVQFPCKMCTARTARPNRRLSLPTERPSLRHAEELLNFAEHLHEPVDLGGGVVEVEAGSGGGLDPQLAHQRLVAVVPAPQGNATLITSCA